MSGRALPPAKLLAVVAPVSLVGVAAFLAATFFFARDTRSPTIVAGVPAVLVRGRRRRVPRRGDPDRAVPGARRGRRRQRRLARIRVRRRGPRPVRLGARAVPL